MIIIDFHSHILPNVDDGAETIECSLKMLRLSLLQGVDVLVATSHFYADEECPDEFLNRRNRAFFQLKKAMLLSPEVYPNVILGAEVLYFPGISDAEDVAKLTIGTSGSILMEPPMITWSDRMLDEIAAFGRNFNCTPVIAHVDRFMWMLKDDTLIDRVRKRGMAVQVNAAYFLNPKTTKRAIQNLKKGKIDLLGSDCHNLESRPPNLKAVRKIAREYGAEAEFKQLQINAAKILSGRSIRHEE